MRRAGRGATRVWDRAGKQHPASPGLRKVTGLAVAHVAAPVASIVGLVVACVSIEGLRFVFFARILERARVKEPAAQSSQLVSPITGQTQVLCSKKGESRCP